MTKTHAPQHQNRLIIVRPVCELQGRTQRMEDVLGATVRSLEAEGTEVQVIAMASELQRVSLAGEHVLFAVCLSEAGVNMEYYRLLEYFRQHPDCLEGAVGGIIVDGSSELFTKALARRLAFSANMAGCLFPGKPLVEATGSMHNFDVLSQVRGAQPMEVYRQQVEELARKLIDFTWPEEEGRLNVLAVHASSRETSNTLLLWDKIKSRLEDRADITEISLRNGSLTDCRGCPYEECLHFGESDGCFYGGIMTEQVYPAIIACDALVMICPNYNDAIGANLTAFINRLTAIFRTHDFSKKRIYALVVSGYSGSDIVAEQVIGAINFNKAFIMPGHFCLTETAHEPRSILAVPDIDRKAAAFADIIR